jgi:hypothetical protein
MGSGGNITRKMTKMKISPPSHPLNTFFNALTKGLSIKSFLKTEERLPTRNRKPPSFSVDVGNAN